MPSGAVLYARVSSKEQEQEGFSIPAQLKLLKEYAAKEGLEIVREFVDVETAKQTGRAAFGEMVGFLKETPSVRTLLVEKTDRLYRNFRDYVIVDDLGVEIHLVKEGEVLSKDSRSHQKFIHGIKVLLAKNYIDNLSEETRKGMQEKAEQGLYPSLAPMGYVNAQVGEKHVIQPDQKVAPMILKLFQWYATGNYSLLEVTRKAHAEGLTYRRSGNKVHKSEVAHILHNPIYYGEFSWKGRLYQGTHEPIIPKELFDAVQRVFAIRDGQKRRVQKYRWAFHELLSCGHCGCAMVAEQKKGKYVYYHCTGHKGRCGEPYVREEAVAKAFGEALTLIQLDNAVLDWLKDALLSSMKDERVYHKEAISNLQTAYQRLQDRLDGLYVDKLDGKIDQDDYLRFSEKWRKEQEDIRRKLERHEKANRSYVDAGITLLELASKAKPLYDKQPMFERRRLLQFVFSNSTWKHGKLHPVFRQPFDLLAVTNTAYQKKPAAGRRSNGQFKDWLPRLDSNQDKQIQSLLCYRYTTGQEEGS